MSPEEKIEAAQKLIDEARAEFAAKKRNWPEKIEPGMLFRCPIGTFLIRYRSHGPLGPINDWDLVEIFTGRYLSGEGGRFSGQEHEFTYLGHARDLIKIADDAHEPTGALYAALIDLERLYRGTNRESREMNAVLRKLDAIRAPCEALADVPEPTGAELVGSRCVYTDDDGRMNDAGLVCEVCEVYEPGRGYSWGTRATWYKHARLAR